MIPRWQIRNMTHPMGARLPKKPIWTFVSPYAYQRDKCRLCNQHSNSWTWWEPTREMLCTRCVEAKKAARRNEFDTFDWRRQGRGFVPANAITMEVAGNLDNMEYRYWVGNRKLATGFTSQQAMCRRCREYTYSPDDREKHKGRFKESCTIALGMAYRELLKKQDRRCIVCGTKCDTQCWGIPMHKEGSCRDRWRFDYQQYPMLELALRQCNMDVLTPEGAVIKGSHEQLYLPSGDEDEIEGRDWSSIS